MKDTYRTLSSPSKEALFKEKNSKFFGYAFPVTKVDEVTQHLTRLKKQHHSARHWCYAYQIGTESIIYRANDDGEPSNSAGQPIYGQIQSFEITNVLIVVVRYFGGVKLGVGGLINAYRTAAQYALNESKIVERTINKRFLILFDYKNMNRVMRIIKEKRIMIVSQKLELDCRIIISIRKNNASPIFEIFNSLYEIKIEEIEI